MYRKRNELRVLPLEVFTMRKFAISWALVWCLLTWSRDGWSVCLSPPGDVTGNGMTTVADVQCVILAIFWSLDGQVDIPPDCIAKTGSPAIWPDHNCDAVINVTDATLGIQFVFNAPLSESLDANLNQCVDSCESDLDGDGDFDFTDCAPQNGLIFSGATELCNGYDDNCDTAIDEPSEPSVAESCSTNTVCDGIETCPTVPVPNSVVIHELYFGGPDAGEMEWIELFNGGNSPVNVQGWRLGNGSGLNHVIDVGAALFIPARGYLVLGTNPDMAENTGVRLNYTYSTYSLDNATGKLTLRNASSALVDEVQNLGALAATANENGSVGLRNPNDDNFVVASFSASTAPYSPTAFGTPGGPNVDVVLPICQPGVPLNCNDGDGCTQDSCDAVAGCLNIAPPACCGNGLKEPGEDCDGTDFGGANCIGLGFEGGALGCNANCTLSTAGCEADICDPTKPSAYFNTPKVTYSCSDMFTGLQVVNMNVSSFVFSKNGVGNLSVGATGGNFPSMTGTMPVCPGGSFTVQSVVFGGCCETYKLTGTYTDENTWTGTMSVSFCQAPFCGCPTGDSFSCQFSTCKNQSFPISGTR